MGTDDNYIRLQPGDIVDIFWNEHIRHNCEILSTPGDTGDLWKYKTPEGNIYWLNPQNSFFQGFKLVKRHEGFIS
jgi:hypothetical protein